MSKELSLYKEFIDAAVSIKDSAAAHWVQKGSFPITESNHETNELLSSLTSDQREVISKIVQDAKESGIHDLLALLSDTSTINYKGHTLPKEPFDTELNYDFIARCEGDQWPE
ncbi:DUF6547 family protein [Marinobacter mobilis]|uniref:DUF6547 family protein n=1 Tax=Marinobacter mobilis TaxID=488533 RepID=UPI0011141349|nr:DUF6547 family protein [Marinobacter mobilis]